MSSRCVDFFQFFRHINPHHAGFLFYIHGDILMTVTVNSVLVERPTVYGNTSAYNVAEVIIPNVPNPAGGGAGDAVTVPIVFNQSNLPSDLDYTVEITPNQACSASYTSKATTGFSVVLTPLTSGATISIGVFDVVVTWDNAGQLPD
jgi:hypothetical protein